MTSTLVSEISSPVWDVFMPPIMDESTTEYEYVEYREKRVNVTDLTDYEFINQDLDLFLLPSESYIQIKANIRSTAASPFNAGEVALVNNGYNLFDRSLYNMNDQPIESLDFSGMATQIKGIVGYQKQYEDSLTEEGWAIDRGDGSITGRGGVITATVAAAADAFTIDANNGLTAAAGGNAAAYAFFLDGQPISLVGRLLPAVSGVINLTNRGGGAAPIAVTGGGVSQFYSATINNKPIQFYYKGYPAYLQSIVNGDLYISNGQAHIAGVSTDFTARYIDDISSNKGFINRRDKLLRKVGAAPGQYDKQINLMLPIKRLFPIFEANQHVYRGVKHTIKLYKNNSLANMVIRNALTNDVAGTGVGTAVGSVNITYASWWIPVLKPSLRVGLEIDKQLAAGTTKQLMWNGFNCYRSNIYQAGETTPEWRITSSSHKPSKIYIVFQLQSRYDSQIQNNMIFDNLATQTVAGSGITRGQIRLASRQFPKEEYTCNFVQGAAEDVARLYAMYLQMHGKLHDTSSSAMITIDEFRDLYPIFCFDVSAQDPQIWSNVTTIDIESRFQLGAAAPGAYYQFALIEYERHITLKGAGQRMAVLL